MHFSKLLVKDVSGEHVLNRVCSIKTVDTVGSNDSLLIAEDHDVSRAQFRFLIESEFDLSHEIIIVVNFDFDLINEISNVLILHLSALMMEVEPCVKYIWIVNFCYYICECSSKNELLFLFINKVD